MENCRKLTFNYMKKVSENLLGVKDICINETFQVITRLFDELEYLEMKGKISYNYLGGNKIYIDILDLSAGEEVKSTLNVFMKRLKNIQA